MRLIDADMLITKLKERETELKEELEEYRNDPEGFPDNYGVRTLNLICGLIEARVEIEYAPTIQLDEQPR